MLNWVVLRMKAFGSEQKSLRAWRARARATAAPRGTDEAKGAVSGGAERLTHLSVLISDRGAQRYTRWRVSIPTLFP